MLHLFRRAFRHNAWANATLLAALLAAAEAPEKAVAAFQHILEAEHNWFHRLLADGSPAVGLWGPASLKGCVPWFAELGEIEAEYFHAISGEDLVHQCTYRNSKGVEFSDRVDNILVQVLLHSSQYRGEAAGLAAAAGIAVPDTDYIYWMRSGEPEYIAPAL